MSSRQCYTSVDSAMACGPSRRDGGWMSDGGVGRRGTTPIPLQCNEIGLVVTDRGLWGIVYQDLVSQGWFLQGVYD